MDSQDTIKAYIPEENCFIYILKIYHIKKKQKTTGKAFNIYILISLLLLAKFRNKYNKSQ